MNNSLSTHSHETTAKRAEKIWQDYGKPVGRDIEIWHEAERQIAADTAIAQLESESNNTYPRVIDARNPMGNHRTPIFADDTSTGATARGLGAAKSLPD